MTNSLVFSPAFGNRPSRLVGRETVIRAFLAGLASRPGSRERALLLLGQRGYGKTVLLWELAEQARAQGFVAASPTIAAEGMMEHIVEKIQDDGERFVKDEALRVSGGTLGAFGFTAGLQFDREARETRSARSRLSHLCARLGELGHGVLILVDELQANSPEIRQLVAGYQELVGEGRDVALVMAGLPGAVAATLNDRVLTFLNRATKITLGPLAVGEIDAFFAQALVDLDIAISPALRLAAAQATQGSPYLLQLVGHYLTLYAGDARAVNEAVLHEAITAAQRDFENDVCGITLAPLSDRDRDFLAAMAEDQGPSKMAILAERLGVSPDYAQKYRKRLIDAGIIEAPRRGEVAFAVPHLAEYLRARREGGI